MKRLKAKDVRQPYTIRLSENEVSLLKKVTDQPSVFIRENAIEVAEVLILQGEKYE